MNASPDQTTPELKPCPNCGKQAGELRKNEWGSRFPWRVQCRECGWSTGSVKLPGVAVKLWNEAKLAKGAKTTR